MLRGSVVKRQISVKLQVLASVADPAAITIAGAVMGASTADMVTISRRGSLWRGAGPRVPREAEGFLAWRLEPGFKPGHTEARRRACGA